MLKASVLANYQGIRFLDSKLHMFNRLKPGSSFDVRDYLIKQISSNMGHLITRHVVQYVLLTSMQEACLVNVLMERTRKTAR